MSNKPFDGLKYIRFVVVFEDQIEDIEFYRRKNDTFVLVFDRSKSPAVVLEVIRQFAVTMNFQRF